MAEPDTDMPTPRNNALAKLDPERVTVAMLVREIASLEKIIDTRLSGMDRAIVLVNDNLIRERGETKKLMDSLEKLHGEKFASIQTQFSERDVRVEQTARDTQKAVDAALQAAKEAVGKQEVAFASALDKSENATTKQIDTLNMTLQQAISGLAALIADAKERLTRLESMGLGRTAAVVEQRAMTTDNRASVAQVLGIVGAGITVVLFLMAFATFVITNMGGA